MAGQNRRGKKFFLENVDRAAVSGRMSQFCEEAHTIYELWKQGEGTNDLFTHLMEEINCSESEATTICGYYNPEKPPEDFCPIESIENGEFRRVFELLALQLPSLSNEGDGVWPKNLLAWVLMRKVYGKNAFDFELHGTGRDGDNKIIFPSLINGMDGNPLPLGLAALDVVKTGELPASVARKAEILISEIGDIGLELAKALLEADIIFPPRKTLQQLIAAVKRGLEGETVVLTGAFCPDYAYIESTRTDVQYEYTFKNVGKGVGLVAQQFVRVLPVLVKFLDDHGIKYRIKLGIGDFEANSGQILESVGVTQPEFIECCSQSLDAFRAMLPDLKLELCLFEQQWANGRWQQYSAEALVAMRAGNFGQIKTNTGKDPVRETEFIARHGASFYRRWFNRPEMEIEEIIEMVVGQGSEYVAMGRVLQDDFGDLPFIQVAGDRPKMQVYNAFHSDHPTLCCKRVY